LILPYVKGLSVRFGWRTGPGTAGDERLAALCFCQRDRKYFVQPVGDTVEFLVEAPAFRGLVGREQSPVSRELQAGLVQRLRDRLGREHAPLQRLLLACLQAPRQEITLIVRDGGLDLPLAHLVEVGTIAYDVGEPLAPVHCQRAPPGSDRQCPWPSL
jgi:hypothetical protein